MRLFPVSLNCVFIFGSTQNMLIVYDFWKFYELSP